MFDLKKINLFFDKNTNNLIGWQTVDVYQNISITYLSFILKNQKLKNNTSVQIFTKRGPLAFLPISQTKTSIVYSCRGNKKIDLVKKYSIGINQWLGNEEELKLLANNIGTIKNPLGRFSHCQKIHKINSSLPSNLEQIFVLKDSNLEDFYSQVDKISL